MYTVSKEFTAVISYILTFSVIYQKKKKIVANGLVDSDLDLHEKYSGLFLTKYYS